MSGKTIVAFSTRAAVRNRAVEVASSSTDGLWPKKLANRIFGSFWKGVSVGH